MLQYDLLQTFGLALALGALIGVDREKNPQNTSFAGIRTFMFFSFLGALSAYLADSFGRNMLIVVMGGVIALVASGYVITSIQTKKMGMTTEVAAILAFIVGILTFLGPSHIAVVVAIAITLALSLKLQLHHFAHHLQPNEFYDGIKFIIIAFVILPLLKNIRNLGPDGVINLYEIWLMVVFVSTLNVMVYTLIKLFGEEKGIILTGILGGFMSSTAVVTSMAENSKKLKNPNPLVFASVIACATMFIRVLLEVYVLKASLVPYIIFPMIFMAVVGYIPVIFMLAHKEKVEKIKMASPLNLGAALKFGVFYLLIILISKFGMLYLGERGLYLSSVISGMVDADTIAIFVSRSAEGSILPQVAGMAILIAAAVNTLMKGSIALIFGSKAYGKNTALILCFVVLAGASIAYFY